MKLLSRRRLIMSAVSILVAVPAVRIAVLKFKNNLLTEVSAPNLVLVDGWLLDASDIEPSGGNG